MTEIALAPELVGSVVGVLLSLLASYVPGFRDRWAALQADTKRAWMAALLVAFSAVIYVLACSGSGFFVVCPEGGAWRLVSIIISALVANQSAYQIAPQPNSVKAISLARKQYDMFSKPH